MNKAPRFSLGKGGLTLFGKSLSFSTVFAGAVVAAIVVVGGVSLSSANPFSPDLAWSERSYETQQAYDSSSYEVQEQNESDDQLHDNEDQQEDTQDPNGDSYSQGSGTVQTIIEDDEGSNKGSGDSGEGSGGYSPTWRDEYYVNMPGAGDEDAPRGDSNRFSSVDDPIASGSVEHKTLDTMQSLDLVYANGRPKVLDGTVIELKNLYSFFEVSGTKKSAETGDITPFAIDKSDLRLGRWQGISSGENDKEFIVEPSANNTYQLPVYYNSKGLHANSYIPCDVYSAQVTFENGSEKATEYIRFDDKNASVQFYKIPEEKWAAALSNDQSGSLFLGWSLREGGDPVGSGIALEKGKSYTLYNLGYASLPTGFEVKFDTTTGEQTLIGIENSAIDGSELTIPAGISSIELESGKIGNERNDIDTIIIPASVSSIDIRSILDAFPKLQRFEVEDGSSEFEATDDGLLLIAKAQEGTDHDGDTIVSILPQWNGDVIQDEVNTSLPANVSSFGEDAFILLQRSGQSPIRPIFMVESPTIKLDEDAFSRLPADSTFMVNNILKTELDRNLAYCSLKSKIALFDTAPSVKVVLQNGTTTGLPVDSYDVDAQSGVVTCKINSDVGPFKVGDEVLCYVPETGESAYTIEGSISVIWSRAFQDAISLKTVKISSGDIRFNDDPFAGTSLDMLIIEDPSALKPLSEKDALFTLASEDADPEPSILLAGTKGFDPEAGSLKDWTKGIISSYNLNDTFEKVTTVIKGEVSEVVLDANTGAIYIKRAGEDGKESLSLYSVPTSTTDFSFLDNTKGIEKEAFKGCSNLLYIQVPGSVSDVAEDAFAKCPSVEVIHFDSSILSDHSNLGSAIQVTSDESEPSSSQETSWVEYIGASTKAECKNLKHVGDKVTTERDADHPEAFYTKTGSNYTLSALLSTYEGSYTLLQKTVAVGDGACKGCGSLSEIKSLGASYSIGASAFEGCTSLNSTPDLAHVTSLGDRAFASSGIEGEITLPDHLNLGSGVFADDDQISQVNLVGNYSTLGESTFSGCGGIEKVSVNVDAVVQTTGKDTFADCTKLLTVDISGRVFEIGEGAFARCEALGTVAFRSSVSTASLKKIDNNAFDDCQVLAITFSQFKNLESIGERAFYNCNDIRRVQLPASLVDLGKEAFATPEEVTSNLTEVNFVSGSKLSRIGEGAFANAAKLTTVDLTHFGEASDSDKIAIGTSAFEDCTTLTRIEIPSRITSVEAKAFAGCTELNTLLFGDEKEDGTRASSNVAALGVGAFANCERIKLLDLSNTQLKAICKQAFYGNLSLTSVVLPASVLSIDSQAFGNCPNLLNMMIMATTPPYVSPQAFDASTLAKLVINVVNAQTSDGSSVLESYHAEPSWQTLFAQTTISSADKNIVTGEANEMQIGGVTYSIIDDEIVLEKADPEVVSGSFIPLAGTTMIAPEAFRDCSALTFFFVPETVKLIGNNAFAGCSSLEGMVFDSDKSPDMANTLFGDTVLPSNFTVFIHRDRTSEPTIRNDYIRRVAFENTNFIAAGDSFLATDNAQALYCDYLDGANVSSRVLLRVASEFTGTLSINNITTTINARALKGCTSLTRVNIPTSVAIIGDEAFMGCTSLVYAPVPNLNTTQLDRIGESAFEGCSKLRYTSIKDGKIQATPILPMSLTSIGKRAFAECDSLPYLSIQGNVTDIPEEMFAGCDKLAYMVFSASYVGEVKSFGARCFKDCVSMTTAGASLSAFTGLERIGEEAYSGCTNLGLVTFPASLKLIGSNAFAGCGKLEAIAFSSKEAPNLAGTGLSGSWDAADIFVPASAWSSYESKIAAAGLKMPDAQRACAGESYRALSSNIYVELTPASALSGDLKLVAMTSVALNATSNPVKAKDELLFYYGSGLTTVEVAPHALEGEARVKSLRTQAYLTDIGEAAFKDCVNLSSVDFGSIVDNKVNTKELRIGDHAFENDLALGEVKLRANTKRVGSSSFANCASKFIFDLSMMSNASEISFGYKVFGDALPTELSIKTKDATARNSFIRVWGSQLMSEYGLTQEDLEKIFTSVEGTKITPASDEASLDAVEDQADLVDGGFVENELDTTDPENGEGFPGAVSGAENDEQNNQAVAKSPEEEQGAAESEQLSSERKENIRVVALPSERGSAVALE